MNGRRLYDLWSDSTADNFSANRGTYRPADTPLPAWPSLSTSSRCRWNDLAKRITPKRKKASS